MQTALPWCTIWIAKQLKILWRKQIPTISVSYIIKVEAHKTAYFYGSRDLVLRPTFMSFMKVY